MANKKTVIIVCIFLVLATISSTLCIETSKKRETPNLPPTVQIEADITDGFVPLSVSFKADAEDPDGLIDKYDWDFGDGAESSKQKIIHDYYEVGVYTATLIVTDNEGAQGKDSLKVTVREVIKPNQLPVAEAQAEPDIAFVNEEITFRGTGTDDDGVIIVYEWDFDGNGEYDWYSNTTGITKHSYNKSGDYTAIFRITDDAYDFDTDSVSVIIQSKANNPPVAIISHPENGATYETNEQIQFNGSESYDPEQESLIYSWDFGDGMASSEPNPTHSYSVNGTYTIVLSVNDGINDATDSISIDIIEFENHAPTAEIVSPEPDQAFEVNTQVNFDGTNSSDPDDDFLFYYWDFGDGFFGTGATSSHIYTEVGTYTVTLRVDDGELSDTDTVRILIVNESVNQPPEAIIDEPENGDNFTIDEKVRFNGSSSSDPDDDLLNFTWDFKDGAVGYGMIVTHKYSTNGTYNVTLTVSDWQYSDTAQVVIIIGPGDIINSPPTAVISEPTRLSSFETNETVNCVGYLSFDPENDFLLYDWDFGDGTEHVYSMNTTHRYTTEGLYLIQLTVSDGEYNDTDSVVITITTSQDNNSAPNAEIVTPTTGQVFNINEVIIFNGSNSSDPDGDSLTYFWYFGDGTTGTGVTTTHSYSVAGLYTITLEVNDGKLNDTARVSIIVRIQFRSSTSYNTTKDEPNNSQESYHCFYWSCVNFKSNFNHADIKMNGEIFCTNNRLFIMREKIDMILEPMIVKLKN